MVLMLKCLETLRTTPHHQAEEDRGASQNCMILESENNNRPEMIGSLSLAKSTSWNHADASFLQQFQAVEHVRGQR